MIQTGGNYNSILQGNFSVEYKFTVNDTTDYFETDIIDGTIDELIFEKLGVGNLMTKVLDIVFLPETDVPRKAVIKVSFRIVGKNSASNWYPKGTYYVSTRANLLDGSLRVRAYDGSLKARVVFAPEGSSWAATTTLALYEEICERLGVSQNSKTHDYIEDNVIAITTAPDIGSNGTTIKEMLSYIGVLYGKNWIVNEYNELAMIFAYEDAPEYDATDILVSPAVTVDRVRIWVNNMTYFEYPEVTQEVWDSMTGFIVEASCPYVTRQNIAEIAGRIIGTTYVGFEAADVVENPALQLGDGLTIDGNELMLAKRLIVIGDEVTQCYAPYEEETENEYPNLDPVARTVAKSEARIQASITTLEDQIELKVDASDFEAAEATNYQSITPMYLANDGTRTPSVDDPNWSTTPPQLQEGQHMWTMTVYVRKSGATSYSQPMDITGTEGAAGRGIERVENFYQVSSSGDTAPSTWPAAGVIPQMTATNRFLWGYETTYYTDNTNESTIPHVIGVYGQTGQNGNDAYNYELIVSNPVIVKSEAGAYNPTSIVLTAKRGQGTGSPANYSGRFKIESTTNNSTWTSVYTSSSNEATRTQSVPNNIIALRCSLYLAGGTTTLLDQQTVPIVSDGATGPQGNAGADGYTVLLSNENHSFAAGTSAATATNITVNVLAYKGATRTAATIGTITGQVTGLTTSLVNNGTTSAGFKVTVTTSLTTKSGQLTIPVTVDGKSFTKIFSWSLALTGQTGAAGDDGDDGVGIASITEYYGRSRVSTTEPTASGDAGSWSTTYQTVDSTWKFLWNYEVVSYTDNTSFTSQKRIIGTYAQDGTDGRNPIAFDQYLCANEDPDNPPVASANWIHVSQFNLADYQDDENHHYYIWTKTKTTWDVGEPTWTEPYLDTYYVNVTAQFNVLTGSINSSVKEVYDAIDREATARKDLEGVVDEYGKRLTTVESLETTVTQTAGGLEAITSWVYGEDGEHGANEYLTTQQSYLRWDGTESTLSVGVVGEAVHTEMRKNAFAVTQNDSDVMIANTSGVTAKSFIAVDSVDIGRFRWVDEGSLGFSLI